VIPSQRLRNAASVLFSIIVIGGWIVLVTLVAAAAFGLFVETWK
jgi:hypothetical protein